MMFRPSLLHSVYPLTWENKHFDDPTKRLLILKADNMVLSLKSQKFNDAISLHVRVSINLNQNHYTNSLFSRDNSTIAVECNDSESKYVKFKDQQLLLRSEFVIYETVRNNKRTLKDAPNSQAKRSKQTSSSTTAITHAQLLASFFDEHAKAYTHSSKLITSLAYKSRT